MDRSLSANSLDPIFDRLQRSCADDGPASADRSWARQPVHTIYGGAHLFKADTAAKLGGLAQSAFRKFAPDDETLTDVFGISSKIVPAVYDRVAEKLSREPVEDLRIDFEDGYGTRPEAEEDSDAVRSALELAKAFEAGLLPPFTGIRVKGLTAESRIRAVRTLDLFLTALVRATLGKLPRGFVITLPKVSSPAQVAAFAEILDELEYTLKLEPKSLSLEIMVETPRALLAADGRVALPALIEAGGGRIRGAHFGPYDYTASLGITAAEQRIEHPACDTARRIMQLSLAGTGVWLADGPINVIPIEPYRGTRLTPLEEAENRAAVHRAWRIHYRGCRTALSQGFRQGWDLHPAQLPSRYSAVFAFIFEGVEAASKRLVNFVEKAAQATTVGSVFDDAATGQGLLNFFERALDCGAITPAEAAELTHLTMDELRSGSFTTICKARAANS